MGSRGWVLGMGWINREDEGRGDEGENTGRDA